MNRSPIELNDTKLNSTDSLLSSLYYESLSPLSLTLSQVSLTCFRRLGASRSAQKPFSTFLSESSEHFVIFDTWE